MDQPSKDRFFSLLSWFAKRRANDGAIRLHELLQVDEISARRRTALGPRLFQIFCASYGELPSHVVLDEIVFKPGGILGLYRDEQGRCIGFSAVKLEAMEVHGRPCAALQGSAYFLPGYRGGRAAGRLATALALGLKLRRPLTPLVYGLEILSPVSYRRATRIFAQLYPHRELETPAQAAAIAEAVIERRGLLPVPGRPSVVRYDDPASHTRAVPDQLLRSDLDVAFYLSRNPDYHLGHILFVVVPLTLINIVASLSPTLTRLLRQQTPAHEPKLEPKLEPKPKEQVHHVAHQRPQ